MESVRQRAQLVTVPKISRKLKKNWKALKASFGYDDTLHYIEKSEQALFALAEELGYWPNVAEWDEYAKKHGYLSVQNFTCQNAKRVESVPKRV